MAEYGKLSPCEIGRECLLKSTQDANQKDKIGVIIDETKTLLKLRVDGDIDNWTFSKKDMMRREGDKRQLPRYKLSFTD